MLNVIERHTADKKASGVITGMSENRKLAIQLDRMVEDAEKKGKPTAHMIDLTPALASLLLDRNPSNRKISANQVERFSYEMTGGRWVFNGEPIIVSDTGELNDGQHRCSAVIESGVSIPVIMIVGVPRDTRTTLDQGRARSAGDYLSMEGYGNALSLAPAAGYAWQYMTYGRIDPKGSRATKSEIINLVDAHPNLVRSVNLFDKKRTKFLGGHAIFAFSHFVISQIARREDVDSFFFSMIEGASLPKGDPALYARNRLTLMTGTRDQNAKAEIIFRAWNAFRRGETVNRFHVSGGLLPLIEG